MIECGVVIIFFRTLLETADGNAVDVPKIRAHEYKLEMVRGTDLDRLSLQLNVAKRANLARPGKVAMADVLLGNGSRVSVTTLDMLGYKEPCQSAGVPGVTW